MYKLNIIIFKRLQYISSAIALCFVSVGKLRSLACNICNYNACEIHTRTHVRTRVYLDTENYSSY